MIIYDSFNIEGWHYIIIDSTHPWVQNYIPNGYDWCSMKHLSYMAFMPCDMMLSGHGCMYDTPEINNYRDPKYTIVAVGLRDIESVSQELFLSGLQGLRKHIRDEDNTCVL